MGKDSKLFIIDSLYETACTGMRNHDIRCKFFPTKEDGDISSYYYHKSISAGAFAFDSFENKDEIQMTYDYFKILACEQRKNEYKCAYKVDAIQQCLILRALDSSHAAIKKELTWDSPSIIRNIKLIMERPQPDSSVEIKVDRGLFQAEVGMFALQILFAVKVCVKLRALQDRAKTGGCNNTLKDLLLALTPKNVSWINTSFSWEDINNPCFQFILKEIQLYAKLDHELDRRFCALSSPQQLHSLLGDIRQEELQRESALHLELLIASAAATKIQTTWRGFWARNKLTASKKGPKIERSPDAPQLGSS
jgi:hypothetical protein